jgi:hypothetical protein
MLPDYPAIKTELQRQLAAWARAQTPIIAPLLSQVSRYTQHEGREHRLIRRDASEDASGYEKFEARIEISKDAVKMLNLPALQSAFLEMARELAGQQTRMMLAAVSASAEQVGNKVDVGGELRPDHVLDMMRRMEIDFDPDTGEPHYGSFVMHPDLLEKLRPKFEAWNRDPALMAENNNILEQKRREWLDRESSRKLVE